MYKLFSQGFGAGVFTNWKSFELLRCLVGRLSLESSRLEFTLEQLIMVHMLEGHPPCQNGQIGQNLFPANVFCLSYSKLVLESKKINDSKQ